MKLTQLLIKVGILHAPAEPEPVAGAAAPAAPAFEKRILKLDDLRAQAGENKARQEELELGLGIGFDRIFAAAGIGETPKGLSLPALHDLVEGKADPEAREILTRAITEKGAQVNEVLLDAQQRDVALDKYEQLLDTRVERFAEAAKRKAEGLREEAQRLLSEAKATEERVGQIRAMAEEWRQRKRTEEVHLEALGRVLIDPPQGR